VKGWYRNSEELVRKELARGTLETDGLASEGSLMEEKSAGTWRLEVLLSEG
jgi:hypothetical protein